MRIEKETLKEAGKHLLNIGLALLVSFLFRPFVTKKVSTMGAVITLGIWLILLTAGLTLINIGGRE